MEMFGVLVTGGYRTRCLACSDGRRQEGLVGELVVFSEVVEAGEV